MSKLTPADAVRVFGDDERKARTNNLSGTATNLDDALYQASVFVGRSPSHTANVWISTAREDADPDTGELYLIFPAEEAIQNHLKEGWRKVYTLQHHTERTV